MLWCAWALQSPRLLHLTWVCPEPFNFSVIQLDANMVEQIWKDPVGVNNWIGLNADSSWCLFIWNRYANGVYFLTRSSPFPVKGIKNETQNITPKSGQVILLNDNMCRRLLCNLTFIFGLQIGAYQRISVQKFNRKHMARHHRYIGMTPKISNIVLARFASKLDSLWMWCTPAFLGWGQPMIFKVVKHRGFQHNKKYNSHEPMFYFRKEPWPYPSRHIPKIFQHNQIVLALGTGIEHKFGTHFVQLVWDQTTYVLISVRFPHTSD